MASCWKFPTSGCKSFTFKNPSFGFYFLRLTTARLFENIERLEKAVLIRDDELEALRAKVAGAEHRRYSAG